MTSTRCHSLIVAALIVMATAAVAVYATDDVVDTEGVGEIQGDIQVQDEEFDVQVITVNVSTGGQLQWHDSQDDHSLTPISVQGRAYSHPHHQPRRRHRHRHRLLGCGGRGSCAGRRRSLHAGRVRGSGHIGVDRGEPRRRLQHQLRSCVGCGRSTEAVNVTTEQRLVGQCARLAARLAADAAADGSLSRDELISRYIARKMHRFGVTDAALRRTVSATIRRRFDDTMTCCEQVATGAKIECLRRTMLRRFERICNDEEPICPWMLLRNSTHQRRQLADDDDDNDNTQQQQQQQQQQPSMTATCCPRQGSERLRCFLDEMEAHRQRWLESMALRAPTRSRETRIIVDGARGMRRRMMHRRGGYSN